MGDGTKRKHSFINPPIFSFFNKKEAARASENIKNDPDGDKKKAIWDKIKKTRRLPSDVRLIEHFKDVLPETLDFYDTQTVFHVLANYSKHIHPEDYKSVIDLIEEKIGFDKFRHAVQARMLAASKCPFLVAHFYKNKPKEFAADMFFNRHLLFKSALPILRANDAWLNVPHLLELNKVMRTCCTKKQQHSYFRGAPLTRLKKWVTGFFRKNNPVPLQPSDTRELEILLDNKSLRGWMGLNRKKNFVETLLKTTNATPEFCRAVVLDPSFLRNRARTDEALLLDYGKQTGSYYLLAQSKFVNFVCKNKRYPGRTVKNYLNAAVKSFEESKPFNLTQDEAFFIVKQFWKRVDPDKIWNTRKKAAYKETLISLSPYFRAEIEGKTVLQLALDVPKNQAYFVHFLSNGGHIDKMLFHEITRYATMRDLFVLSNMYEDIRKDISTEILRRISVEGKEVLTVALESAEIFQAFIENNAKMNKKFSEAMAPVAQTLELINLSNLHLVLRKYTTTTILEALTTKEVIPLESKDISYIFDSASVDQLVTMSGKNPHLTTDIDTYLLTKFRTETTELTDAARSYIENLLSRLPIEGLVKTAKKSPSIAKKARELLLSKIKIDSVEISPDAKLYIIEHVLPAATNDELIFIRNREEIKLTEAADNQLIENLLKMSVEELKTFILEKQECQTLILSLFDDKALSKRTLELLRLPEITDVLAIFKGQSDPGENNIGAYPELSQHLPLYDDRPKLPKTEQVSSFLHQHRALMMRLLSSYENFFSDTPDVLGRFGSFATPPVEKENARLGVRLLNVWRSEGFKDDKMTETEAQALLDLYPALFEKYRHEETLSALTILKKYQENELLIDDIARLAEAADPKLEAKIKENLDYVVWLLNKDPEMFEEVCASHFSMVIHRCHEQLSPNALKMFLKDNDHGKESILIGRCKTDDKLLTRLMNSPQLKPTQKDKIKAAQTPQQASPKKVQIRERRARGETSPGRANLMDRFAASDEEGLSLEPPQSPPSEEPASPRTLRPGSRPSGETE